MEDVDTRTFLKEREEKLGAKIIWKTYATFFSQLGGEKREYGVFIYSDGKRLVIEDFERVPSIMGIALPSRRKKEEYIKLEIMLNISEIRNISLVTRKSVNTSISKAMDCTKTPTLLAKIFRKLLTKVVMNDDSTYFFELIDHKAFTKWINKEKKEIENGSI